MKVLYVASRGAGETSLMLEREITELQTRAIRSSTDVVRFKFLPDLALEEFPMELAREQPDILHISAHGARSALSLSAALKDAVPLSGALLRSLLPDPPPRLVYLNACNSAEIAKELTTVVPMAIGSTAPISNRAARAGAVLFYNRLIDGCSVYKAHEASRSLIKALDRGRASSVLYRQQDVDPAAERLHVVPRIVAKFTDDGATPDQNGQYRVHLGVVGCPPYTVQIVIFTNDPTYITEDDNLEDDLCLVVRSSPTNGVIWADHFEWTAYGDVRLFAAGASGSREAFVLSATLCEALEEQYRRELDNGAEVGPKAKFRRALAQLRLNDGSN
jgi:hypothetical protein